MFRSLACIAASITTLALWCCTAQAQLVVQPFHAPPGVPQDWAKYGSTDWSKFGFEYYGQGTWAKGFIATASRGSGTSLTGPYVMSVFYPFYFPPEPPSDYGNSPGDVPSMDWVHAPGFWESRDPIKSSMRQSTRTAKVQAEKLIALGDQDVAARKYAVAVDHYQAAARSAPDMPEAHFRHAFALIAKGRGALASQSFRRGLGIRQVWQDSPFDLHQLYDEEQLSKTTEKLAKAVEARPMDGDLALALGMQLFFSGQREKSGVYFNRAAFLGANQGRLLDDFLPANVVAAAPDANR